MPAVIKLEVINNGEPAQAEVTRSTQPDGSELIRLVLSSVADDIGNGGRVAGAMKGRFGLREAV